MALIQSCNHWVYFLRKEENVYQSKHPVSLIRQLSLRLLYKSKHADMLYVCIWAVQNQYQNIVTLYNGICTVIGTKLSQVHCPGYIEINSGLLPVREDTWSENLNPNNYVSHKSSGIN